MRDFYGRRRLLSQDFIFQLEHNNQRPILVQLNDSSAIDSSFQPGVMTEYSIIFVSTTPGGVQYVRTGILPICRGCPQTEARGTMILVAEKLIRDSLPQELEQLRQDLKADGWKVRTVSVAATDAVTAVKDSIRRIYFADSTQVKQVYLLGHVPVPYSGQLFPDGHQDHIGAWPADGYYISFDIDFTDLTVNNSSGSRPATRNIPGDGKFDQTQLGLKARLGICRVDMSNLPLFMSIDARYREVFLTRRYLQKAHRFKMGEYATNGQGLIDDNFGYFNGEAFAGSGWQTMNACLGQDKIRNNPLDLLADSRTQHWLMGYGCGGGGYESCGGIGTSRNFATDSVNVVFMQLFGSYFGDWDSPNNLMRSALASRGGVLTCSWSGRPWQYYHMMGIGQPLGEASRTSMFNDFGQLWSNFGPRLVHLGFLGDPSLRLHHFTPPAQAQARQSAPRIIEVLWSPGRDTVEGYHLYRSTDSAAGFHRITARAMTDTLFHDTVSASGTYRYMARGVRTQAYPGGTYINQSLGTFTAPVSVLVANQPKQIATLHLYPNPTAGHVRITSSALIQQVQVLDGLGRSVLMKEANARSVEVDLSGLPRGMYTVKVFSSGEWQVKRVVRG